MTVYNTKVTIALIDGSFQVWEFAWVINQRQYIEIQLSPYNGTHVLYYPYTSILYVEKNEITR